MSDEPDYANFRLTPPTPVIEPMPTLPLPRAAPRLWQALRNAAALCGEIEKVSVQDDAAERSARLCIIALAAKGLMIELSDLMTVRFPGEWGTYVDGWPKARAEDDPWEPLAPGSEAP